MTVPATATTTSTSDILHFANHSRLSTESIAKAVARHQREHPSSHPMSTAAKFQNIVVRNKVLEVPNDMLHLCG